MGRELVGHGGVGGHGAGMPRKLAGWDACPTGARRGSSRAETPAGPEPRGGEGVGRGVRPGRSGGGRKRSMYSLGVQPK